MQLILAYIKLNFYTHILTKTQNKIQMYIDKIFQQAYLIKTEKETYTNHCRYASQSFAYDFLLQNNKQNDFYRYRIMEIDVDREIFVNCVPIYFQT